MVGGDWFSLLCSACLLPSLCVSSPTGSPARASGPSIKSTPVTIFDYELMLIIVSTPYSEQYGERKYNVSRSHIKHCRRSLDTRPIPPSKLPLVRRSQPARSGEMDGSRRVPLLELLVLLHCWQWLPGEAQTCTATQLSATYLVRCTGVSLAELGRNASAFQVDVDYVTSL